VTRETAHDAGVGTVFDRSALELINHRFRFADADPYYIWKLDPDPH
jgi:hypothetical protein